MEEKKTIRPHSPYYIGLDVGTNSVGWAVTDPEYNVLRFKGNSMWGARLFEEAKPAADRRAARIARRRLERRKQRLLYLEEFFSAEIGKSDPLFFRRLHESALFPDDKTAGAGKYTLFNDPDFMDRDYLRRYPTVYHLRSELVHSSEPHDPRLVFLALHHIIKHRGHFLYETSENGDECPTVDAAMRELTEYLSAEMNVELGLEPEYFTILTDRNMRISQKKAALRAALGRSVQTEESGADIQALSDLLAGAKVKLAALYDDKSLKNAEPASVALSDDLDAVFDALSSALGERVELLLAAKKVFDAARLSEMRGGEAYLCDAKVRQYEKNHADLRALKDYVREAAPDKYRSIFYKNAKFPNNYAAYSRYRSESGDKTCKQEDFCAFLKSVLPKPAAEHPFAPQYAQIEEKTFLPRLTGSENGIIPYQLHRLELRKILDNASAYLPFLLEEDEDGISVREKIEAVFSFRVPYYVGPLKGRWAERTEEAKRTGEKAYPWNFEKVVDLDASAAAFLKDLIGKCTYTGAPVLPKDSLLYSEFMLLNELNPLRLNGNELPVSVKQQLIEDLFKKENRRVTKKRILDYLVMHGYAAKTDEISGIDDPVKTRLRSYHDFAPLIPMLGEEAVEKIIEGTLVYSDDKRMLRRWLKKNFPALNEDDVRKICRLKYADWGRLSKEFLTELYSGADEQGEAQNILYFLRNTNLNLMQLLNDPEHTNLPAAAEERRLARFGSNSLRSQLDEMYISPAVRRSIWQTLKIAEEIAHIRGGAPAKIFVEVARGEDKEKKGTRTKSRKEQLLELYKACERDSGELYEKLAATEESALRRDKLFLYYTQFGKCMYSGEPIDLETALRDDTTYDVDHIFPRSRIKDDSIENRVLVKSVLNREKTNTYPISQDIRSRMLPFWSMLHDKKMIGDKKFDRLKRNTELTDDELAAFVQRQLTETQQSTKALAQLLQEIYPEAEIVYSKAGNVSEFRQEFGLLKCREVNDLHHAKDAYLNIVVGNVYKTKFTDRFFLNIRKENYSLKKVFDWDTPGAWKADGTSIATVKKYMAKNNPIITRMPREEKGQLFNLNIMPAGLGQLPIKAGKPIEKYGGYNKLAGSYYCVVEHTEKKKRVRSIETVLLYARGLYESDPVKYCCEILGLVDPVVVAPKICIDALLELDGFRLYPSGRTGDMIVYKHGYPLAIDAERERYVRNLTKYIERCAKIEYPATAFDGISAEENVALYNWFVERLESSVYGKLMPALLSNLKSSAEAFEKMGILSQAKTLMEILKAFKCDAQNPNLKELCGKGLVGRIQKKAALQGFQSAYLINQSPTGLYEYRTDLLH